MMGDTEDTVPAGQQDTFQASSSYVMVRVAFSWCSQGPLVKLVFLDRNEIHSSCYKIFAPLYICYVSWWR